MKEEEKVSNGVQPWSILCIHSAKVLLTGVADLFCCCFMDALWCAKADCFSMFELPCNFLPILIKLRYFWSSLCDRG